MHDRKLLERTFFQHPLNHAMLEGGSLAQYDPQELAIKYIGLVDSGQRPTEEQVEAVRTGVIDYCRQVHGDDEAAVQADIAGIGETWPEMHERFAANYGLTMMMLQYGVKSRFFYQYLYTTGLKRPFYGLALLAKDGWGVPVSAGKMETPVLELIPEDDWMYVVSVEEPSHAGRRATDGAPQEVLRRSKMIFDGGCGMASAYWNYGYPLGELDQQIVLCDQDERLIPYLLLVLQCSSLEEMERQLGVRFIAGNLLEVMAQPEFAGKFDVIRLTGLLSYQPDAEKRKIMQLAKQMLAPGGVIICDEWIMELSLVRSAKTTIWPFDPSDPYRLNPAPSVEAAVDKMSQICKEIGLPYVYVTDFCNGNPVCWTQAAAKPTCVMFAIGESASADCFDLIPGAEVLPAD